jgi:hypothetical protein
VVNTKLFFMAYIFLDESGDLGFDFTKPRTSKFFVITCLLVPINKNTVEKIVKKTHAELSKKLKRRIGELHSVQEKPITRQRLLKRLCGRNIRVMTIYLNKRKVYTKMQEEKPVLYNYVANILLDRIYSKHIVPMSEAVILVASRRETNKFLNENFKDYLSRQIKNNHQGNLEVVIRTPAEEKCLQAVDFVSWAIFRKYEYGDATFYDLIKNKIIEERPLFGDK